MTRDNEIPAIFNPRRVRAPSVVVTGDSPNGSFAGGGFTNILHSSNPQISTSNLLGQSDADNVPATPNQVTSTTPSANTALVPAQNASTPVTTTATTTAATTTTTTTTSTGEQRNRRKLTKCKERCCAENAQKVNRSYVRYNPIYNSISFESAVLLRHMRDDFDNSQLGRCNALHKISVHSTRHNGSLVVRIDVGVSVNYLKQ